MSSIINKPSQLLTLWFIILILSGTLLLQLPVSTTSKHIGFLDAIFTSTSAACVTGLIVKDTPKDFTFFGQLVILILIQVGGIGLMTVTGFFLLLLGKKFGIKERMLLKETYNASSMGGLIRFMLRVIIYSFTIETVGAILLFIDFSRNMDVLKALWFAIFHSVSAFNNAGFALFSNSLVNYVGDPLVNITIMLLIFLGGLGFVALSDITNFMFKKEKISIYSKLVLKVSIILVILGAIAFFSIEYANTMKNLSLGSKILASFFQSVTTRTAGFNTLDFGAMKPSILLITMILMFIGGSPGSTAGGIKTTTFLVSFSSILQRVYKGRKNPVMEKRSIEDDSVKKAHNVLMFGFLTVFGSFFLLTLVESSYPFSETLFETVSAYGTVGLSMGLTSHLNDFGKIIITLTMLIGKVGPLGFFTLFAKGNTEEIIQYPPINITVG
jgi:trk system potassium uptake protein TrkH